MAPTYFELTADPKNFVALFTALAAVIGFMLTVVQLRRNLQFQRETVAKTTYREYLKLCVERPNLASGKVEKENNSREWEQYKWFVSLLIWACEEVVEYAPHDEVWLANITLELGYHGTYLASDEFDCERQLYTRKVRKIIQDVVNSAKSKK